LQFSLIVVAVEENDLCIEVNGEQDQSGQLAAVAAALAQNIQSKIAILRIFVTIKIDFFVDIDLIIHPDIVTA